MTPRRRGLRLMLDFAPNHTALDHPWVEDHPEYFVSGTELDLTQAPQNYIIVDTIVRLKDLTSAARFDREGDNLTSRGLYLDMPLSGYHMFEVEKLGRAGRASIMQNSGEIANERGT